MKETAESLVRVHTQKNQFRENKYINKNSKIKPIKIGFVLLFLCIYKYSL